jgi:hypothetical protein
VISAPHVLYNPPLSIGLAIGGFGFTGCCSSCSDWLTTISVCLEKPKPEGHVLSQGRRSVHTALFFVRAQQENLQQLTHLPAYLMQPEREYAV